MASTAARSYVTALQSALNRSRSNMRSVLLPRQHSVMHPFSSHLSRLSECERAAHRAHDQLRREMAVKCQDRLQSRAVLRHDVVEAHRTEHVHHLLDSLTGQAGEVETADDGVDLVDAGDAASVTTDPYDATMRAGCDHHETPVPHVGHERLLADERVLHDLAVPLHAQRRWNHLERHGLVHLPRQQDALGQHGRYRHDSHVEVLARQLVAPKLPDVDPLAAALVVAWQEVVGASVKDQTALHRASVRGKEAGEAAEMILVSMR